MKTIIIISLLALTLKVSAQAKTDSLPSQRVITDSSEIYSVNDINTFLNYTEDKLLARDYLLIRNWWQVYILDRKKKLEKPVKPKKK